MEKILKTLSRRLKKCPVVDLLLSLRDRFTKAGIAVTIRVGTTGRGNVIGIATLEYEGKKLWLRLINPFSGLVWNVSKDENFDSCLVLMAKYAASQGGRESLDLFLYALDYFGFDVEHILLERRLMAPR
jgi:hypothetical protein